ncbi:MAG: porin [Candidatus Cyclobacteriaceae bacterium M3_2C_046]
MKKGFILSLLLISFFMIKAQDVAVVVEEEDKLSISGSIDTYFRTTLNTNDLMEGDPVAPPTSFANGTGFAIGMANMIFSYEGEKAGFTADLVFGPRGDDAVFLSAPFNAAIVNQLYAYWNVSDAVTLTLGNFNTFLGYEVISPAGNFHYSTSYMFSYGPFSHTGLKADVDLGGGLSAMVSLMNPTDFTEFNPVNTYTLGFQLGYEGETGGSWLNIQYGDQDGNPEDGDGNVDEVANNLFQIDLTTGYNLTDAFYLGLNTTYNTTSTEVDGVDAGSFMGFALYPEYSFSDAFALGLRGEYFAVDNFYLDGVVPLDTEGSGNVFALTISGNVNVGNLRFIPEIRMDMFSDNFYADRDGEPVDNLSSFLLAAVYSF